LNYGTPELRNKLKQHDQEHDAAFERWQIAGFRGDPLFPVYPPEGRGMACGAKTWSVWPGITGELPASAQQILAGVCLCVTKSAQRHTADPGFSHPLDSVEYDCYCAHGWSIDYSVWRAC
jgi:hypothetical protein